LILIMPLVPKRKIRKWFFRWLKFEIFERSKMSKKRSVCFPYIIQGISNLIRLMKIDPISIINEIPEGNLVIIKGKSDNYFFDGESARIMREKKIRIIELDEVGHNWNKKIISEVEKLIDNWE